MNKPLPYAGSAGSEQVLCSRLTTQDHDIASEDGGQQLGAGRVHRRLTDSLPRQGTCYSDERQHATEVGVNSSRKTTSGFGNTSAISSETIFVNFLSRGISR
jgi:hypothetical protein